MNPPPDLDLGPLTDRPPRSERRRFRAEAAAGEHGDDVASPSFADRRSVAVSIAGAVGTAAFVPVFWTLDAPGRWWGVGAFGACVVFMAAVAFGERATGWSGLVDRRLRLARFAATNGGSHEARGTLNRPRRGHEFHHGRNRRHADLIRIPAPAAFDAANYTAELDSDDPDLSRLDVGYVVFRLAEPGPPTFVGHGDRGGPSALRRRERAPLGGGWTIASRDADHPVIRAIVTPDLITALAAFGRTASIEITGDELYVQRPSHLPLGSPRFWAKVGTIRRLLAPRLSPDLAPTEERV